MPKVCPDCHLISPDEALQCDCGRGLEDVPRRRFSDFYIVGFLTVICGAIALIWECIDD